MALGSTKPLMEMNTRKNSLGVKATVGRADNLATIVLKPGSLNFLERPGPVQAYLGL
jgi:hypothetical protein